MTSGAGEEQIDLYDPAYIYRSIFGNKMKGHRQTWPSIDLSELQSINPDCVGWIHMVCTMCAFSHEPFDMFAAFAVIEGESPHEASAGAIPSLSSDQGGTC